MASRIDHFRQRDYVVITRRVSAARSHAGTNIVKSKIISIGNYQGIRIPKPILERIARSKDSPVNDTFATFSGLTACS